MSQTRQLNLRTCSNLLYLWTNEFLETNYIFTQLFSGWENQILPKEKSNVVKNCNSRDEKCKCLNFYWLNPLLDIWWDWYVVMLAGPILSCQSFALVGYLGQAWILWEYWSRKFEKKKWKKWSVTKNSSLSTSSGLVGWSGLLGWVDIIKADHANNTLTHCKNVFFLLLFNILPMSCSDFYSIRDIILL